MTDRQKMIFKEIMDDTYQYNNSKRDGRWFTPNFIRIINENWDIELMLFIYLISTPFNELDVNFLREFRKYLYPNCMFQYLMYCSTENLEEKKKYNPNFWNQFCKQYEDRVYEQKQKHVWTNMRKYTISSKIKWY